GVPLLLLTADRPPELRGVGANQATMQPGLFGSFTRMDVDAEVPSADSGSVWAGLGERAVRAALGLEGEGLTGVAGPVHLNLPFREPLSAATAVTASPGAAPSLVPEAPTVLDRGLRTVVIAGADAGP